MVTPISLFYLQHHDKDYVAMNIITTNLLLHSDSIFFSPPDLKPPTWSAGQPKVTNEYDLSAVATSQIINNQSHDCFDTSDNKQMDDNTLKTTGGKITACYTATKGPNNRSKYFWSVKMS